MLDSFTTWRYSLDFSSWCSSPLVENNYFVVFSYDIEYFVVHVGAYTFASSDEGVVLSFGLHRSHDWIIVYKRWVYHCLKSCEILLIPDFFGKNLYLFLIICHIISD